MNMEIEFVAISAWPFHWAYMVLLVRSPNFASKGPTQREGLLIPQDTVFPATQPEMGLINKHSLLNTHSSFSTAKPDVCLCFGKPCSTLNVSSNIRESWPERPAPADQDPDQADPNQVTQALRPAAGAPQRARETIQRSKLSGHSINNSGIGFDM